ncbi:MAG: hypothetical protein WBU20_06560, partial [Candidatus Acidiferrum sp.]
HNNPPASRQVALNINVFVMYFMGFLHSRMQTAPIGIPPSRIQSSQMISGLGPTPVIPQPPKKAA